MPCARSIDQNKSFQTRFRSPTNQPTDVPYILKLNFVEFEKKPLIRLHLIACQSSNRKESLFACSIVMR